MTAATAAKTKEMTMPAALTYPGVYVEEIPSGVRTITGVATSITAFVGRALRGAVNDAIVINSYADYEREFGGLWLDSSMSFAARDFFANGGQKGVIVRLFHAAYADADIPATSAAAKSVADAAKGAANAAAAKAAAKTASDAITNDAGKSAAEKAAAKAVLDAVAALADTATTADIAAAADAAAAPASVLASARIVDEGNTFRFVAANPGKWGAGLRVEIDGNTSKDYALALGLGANDLFNLAVIDVGSGRSERFLNLSTKASARRVDKVLLDESDLIRWDTAAVDLDGATPTVPAALHTRNADGTWPVLRDAVRKLEWELAQLKAKVVPDTAAIAAKQAALSAAMQAALDAVTDGGQIDINDFLPDQGEANKLGMYALEQLYARDELFNLLCLPPYTPTSAVGFDADVDANLVARAASYCEKRRAMLIVDPRSNWDSKTAAIGEFTDATTEKVGTRSRNAALFFPHVVMPNPLRGNQLESFVPSGVVAGIFARTDAQRGVWKAPAGIDASLAGVSMMGVPLTDDENGDLNPLGINCLRSFPVYGRVLWGSRTLRGADAFADEYKYIPVRRTALYIEESLYRGLKWVVFEPNDEPLWAQIRLNVGAFMHNLFRQGAFQGRSPREAYFVKCDSESTTQNDINLGIVNIIVGFAPLKPAEFVVIKLQQIAGQIEV